MWENHQILVDRSTLQRLSTTDYPVCLVKGGREPLPRSGETDTAPFAVGKGRGREAHPELRHQHHQLP